ncbi:MAG TPA: hypothetical protein VF220_05355 [Nitrososphaeraceae archaeon]
MNYYTGENEGDEESKDLTNKILESVSKMNEQTNKEIQEECEHEYESYGTIDTETDFYGLKDLVGYECIKCGKEFTEWTYRN